MVKFDMWYGDSLNDVTRADCTFYPGRGSYCGNLYIGRRIVGDYIATDSAELEKRFNALGFAWRWAA